MRTALKFCTPEEDALQDDAARSRDLINPVQVVPQAPTVLTRLLLPNPYLEVIGMIPDTTSVACNKAIDDCAKQMPDGKVEDLEVIENLLDAENRAVLCLYSAEPIYRNFNRYFRLGSVEQASRYFDLARILIEAMKTQVQYKPSVTTKAGPKEQRATRMNNFRTKKNVEGVLFRGVGADLCDLYTVGQKFTSWFFESTSKAYFIGKEYAMRSPQRPKGTVFYITGAFRGADLAATSKFANTEEEVLFYPGTSYKVAHVERLSRLPTDRGPVQPTCHIWLQVVGQLIPKLKLNTKIRGEDATVDLNIPTLPMQPRSFAPAVPRKRAITLGRAQRRRPLGGTRTRPGPTGQTVTQEVEDDEDEFDEGDEIPDNAEIPVDTDGIPIEASTLLLVPPEDDLLMKDLGPLPPVPPPRPLVSLDEAFGDGSGGTLIGVNG